MIVYNIEDFVIKQMFRPYKPLLVSEEGLPENELDRLIAYDKRVKECEAQLRKQPEKIITILNNNKEAKRCVFERLAQIDFKFYKWLKHPLIDEIMGYVIAFRYELKRSENDGKD